MRFRHRFGLALMIVGYMLWAVFYIQGLNTWVRLACAFVGGLGFILLVGGNEEN